jgi:hypothetical protein
MNDRAPVIQMICKAFDANEYPGVQSLQASTSARYASGM